MIERSIPCFGRLVFDRDAIVRAALRAYVETYLASVDPLGRLSAPPANHVSWTGDLQRGAFYKDGGSGSDGDYDVVAWTEAGVVGLAWELGWGPIEQLSLSVDAVTGGPDDVRAALPGLPDELEPALVLATRLLEVGNEAERLAGIGFWLYGDRVAGTLFDDPTACGADRLVAWGALQNGRLPRVGRSKEDAAFWAELDRTRGAAMHAFIDTLVDRRMRGPTEITAGELETLLPKPPDPERLLCTQRGLQEVGIIWPGSPKIPDEPKRTIDVFTGGPYVEPDYLTRCFGRVVFDRDAIVRAALRAYVESILGPLDPLARHVLTACVVPKWTGDPKRGAFFNGDGCGDYDVVAWTEAGVIGLAYKRAWGPIQQLGLSASAVTGGPEDVRAALPGLPDELLPALEMATGLLEVGAHGEKLAGVGFWMHGDRAAGTLFDDPTLPGARRLVAWGALKKGHLPLLGDRRIAALAAMLARTTASPIHALLDTVVDRRLRGPTELLPNELTALFPTPPDPKERSFALWMLQKVGITWPGSSEIPEEPRRAGSHPSLAPPTAIARPHPLGYLAFDRDAIVRAALRAYVEVILAHLEPIQRHGYTASYIPNWTGDLQRGAFYNGDLWGGYDVVAWTEAGVVGLAYERGFGPIEQLGLSVDAVKGGPDDVRAALPELPAALEPTFEMAVAMLEVGAHGEKLASVGFWLHGDRVAGTLFDNPMAPGIWRLAFWGRVGRGRLLPARDPQYGKTVAKVTPSTVISLLAIIDAVVERALIGPTELTTDELATLLATPPAPHRLHDAQRMLQKVGITWPGSPEIPK